MEETGIFSKVYQFWCDHHVMIVSILGAIVAWVDGKGVARKYLEQGAAATKVAEDKYRALKQEAKSRNLVEKAEMAFQFVNKLSRTTSTDIDDKAAEGLKKAIDFMKKAGWGEADIGNDDKDIILGHFDRLHEVETQLLEASKLPLVPDPQKPGASG